MSTYNLREEGCKVKSTLTTEEGYKVKSTLTTEEGCKVKSTLTTEEGCKVKSTLTTEEGCKVKSTLTTDDKSDFKADIDNHSTTILPCPCLILLSKKREKDKQIGKRQFAIITSLESVLLQLQDSWRKAQSDARDLQQDNVHLVHQLREHENFWRLRWQAKTIGQAPED
ncbi:hypothetical protein C8R48DRAFT_674182 [Suillus tomentosus]|nr:hypothetical protein C8R48DRAFT_674182 [Suillus tomentosus]